MRPSSDNLIVIKNLIVIRFLIDNAIVIMIYNVVGVNLDTGNIMPFFMDIVRVINSFYGVGPIHCSVGALWIALH